MKAQGYETAHSGRPKSGEPGMRLYFMGRHRRPLIDPRDVPRTVNGYPLPSFEVTLGRGAVAAARAGSFVDTYAARDFTDAFPQGTEPAPLDNPIVPVTPQIQRMPAEVLPVLELVA
jgi:hypothetical protein